MHQVQAKLRILQGTLLFILVHTIVPWYQVCFFWTKLRRKFLKNGSRANTETCNHINITVAFYLSKAGLYFSYENYHIRNSFLKQMLPQRTTKLLRGNVRFLAAWLNYLMNTWFQRNWVELNWIKFVYLLSTCLKEHLDTILKIISGYH